MTAFYLLFSIALIFVSGFLLGYAHSDTVDDYLGKDLTNGTPTDKEVGT